MKKGMVLVSAFVIVAFLAAFPVVSYGTTYEDLVRTYIEKEELREQPGTEIIGLQSAKADVEELWESLVNEKDPMGKIRISTRIIKVIADGNISEWDMIRGFTGSEGYSKSIMVFQASLIRIASLIELDNEKDAWLANRYARDLFKVSGTYKVIYYISKDGFLDAGSMLHVAGGQDWVDKRGGKAWEIKNEDILPFNMATLKKVRGRITTPDAFSKDMIFLDKSGRPVRGGASYAWEWRSGKVYRIWDRESSNRGSFSSGTSIAAFPGEISDNPSPGGGTGNDPGDRYNNSGNNGNDNNDDENNGGDNNGNNDNSGGGNDGNNGNDGGPGNGNGNNGNPGNGGGNTGGSGPGSGNGGENNGNNDNSGGGNDGNNGNDGGSNGNGGGSRSGLGDGTNPGGGSDNNNAGGSAGGTGTENPGEN